MKIIFGFITIALFSCKVTQKNTHLDIIDDHLATFQVAKLSYQNQPSIFLYKGKAITREKFMRKIKKGNINSININSKNYADTCFIIVK